MSAPCPTLGFRVAFTLGADHEPAQRDAVSRAFLETLASFGLAGVSTGDAGLSYTITGDGTQATDSDRERVLAWLDEQPEIASHRAGPLTDVGERM